MTLPAASRARAPNGATPAGLAIRPAVLSDHALIYSSWLRTYATSALARVMAEPVYMAGQHALIERLLGQGRTLVVAPEGDDSTVLGWLVHEGHVLHYVYVKGDLRRHGLARALLDHAGLTDRPVVYTHSTHLWSKALHLLQHAVYNPLGVSIGANNR